MTEFLPVRFLRSVDVLQFICNLLCFFTEFLSDISNASVTKPYANLLHCKI